MDITAELAKLTPTSKQQVSRARTSGPAEQAPPPLGHGERSERRTTERWAYTPQTLTTRL